LFSITHFTNFSDFEETLRKLSPYELNSYRKTYNLKSSIVEKITVECLKEKDEVIKRLNSESKKLKHDFNLAHVASIDLEKKIVDLADALKKCQDEKKVTEDALESSKKDLEKLKKTHDDDLKLIENLRKDCKKSSKAADDLHVSNADLSTRNSDLVKTLSSKEQQIQDLEKVLSEQSQTSGQVVNDINKS
jgi:chromosome segregation ATPase